MRAVRVAQIQVRYQLRLVCVNLCYALGRIVYTRARSHISGGQTRPAFDLDHVCVASGHRTSALIRTRCVWKGVRLTEQLAVSVEKRPWSNLGDINEH